MKNLFKVSLIFLLLLSSCSKDNNDQITPEVKEEGVSTELVTNLSNSVFTSRNSNQESDYLEDGQCFEINYPYDISDSFTNTTINSDEELEAYMQSLSEESVVFIVVPFDVTLEDGTQQTISTYDDFYSLIISCYEGNQDSSVACFSLNFPLTAYDSDGNEVTVNSEQELFSFDFSGFVYPVNVTFMDGTQGTLNSSEDFDALYNECYGIEDCEDCTDTDVCFEIVFPFSFISDTGEFEHINDYDQLWEFLSSLTEDDTYMISYPITVEFEDGTQQTANSDEEFAALYDSCD